MTVKILKTGQLLRTEDGYAQRLIEQGRAVPSPEKKAEAPKAEADKAPSPKKKG